MKRDESLEKVVCFEIYQNISNTRYIKFPSHLECTGPNCIDDHFQVFCCCTLRTVQGGNPWNLPDNPKIKETENYEKN